ncbi:MAG: TraB/GumN family protein [Segetibacter sp.]|nr:TraB/GumN family protein [Segetibacter sp.]
MKKVLHIIVTLLVFTKLTSAQVPTEKALLWEVTGKNIQQPSYLFGTIHLMCPDEMKVPAKVAKAFEVTKSLYLEVDLDDPQTMLTMLMGMKMHDTSTLQNLMGNDFDSANAIFQKRTGISLKLMNTAKPLMLMSLIYPGLMKCTPASWESVFQNMAKEKGYNISGLEDVSEQVKVFEKIPYKVQAEMLTKMLLNIDSARMEFEEMLNVYRSKDINKMYQLTTEEKDFGEYEGIMLSDRNHNWIPVIGEQVKKMPTFFAFGAGHLGGEKGVINLLRRQGYKVKPVYY